MALPAMWIRKNMLGSPSPSCSYNERTLTEAEKKVQRSLQKLSIPEWYLNNSSRPPKILSSDRSYELRPAPWKEQRHNKKIVCSTPVMSTKNSTVNRNGLLETTFEFPDDSQTSQSSPPNQNSNPEPAKPSTKSPAPLPKNSTTDKKSPRSRSTNISRTYPRISPSRKIQNINIVFPNHSNNSSSRTITSVDDVEESEMNMTKDSLEITTTIPETIEEEIEPTTSEEDVSMSQSLETKISRLPNQRLTYIKPWKSPINRAISNSKSNTVADYKSTTASSPVLPKDSDEESTAVRSKMAPTSAMGSLKVTEALETTRQPPKIIPRASKLSSPSHEDEELCDACKSDPSRRINQTIDDRGVVGFRPRTLYPIDEQHPVTPKPRKSPPPIGVSPTIAFLASKKKSSELRNIVKIKEEPRGGKSLVQEIIEEFNEKCKNSEQPSYVTRGSKKFVKKLVRALENNNPSENDEEDSPVVCERVEVCAEDRVDDEETESSEHSSEDEIKSVAISTSISYKDTDSSNSSDSEARSPTLKNNYDYDWNMNVSNVNNVTLKMVHSEMGVVKSEEEEKEEDEEEDEEEEEESVYWIPVTKTKLPRTSSLLSMISRLSMNGPGQLSPCISPIRQNNDPKRSQNLNNAWGSTLKTSDYVRTLRRIEETTILDSGYSDRSRGRCSVSSDCTWYDDMETTQTASEIGSCNSFSHGSYSRRSGNQFLSRPFVI